jgi:hypothetical protein
MCTLWKTENFVLKPGVKPQFVGGTARRCDGFFGNPVNTYVTWSGKMTVNREMDAEATSHGLTEAIILTFAWEDLVVLWSG